MLQENIVKNDSMCDMLCYVFIVKLQNFLIAPLKYSINQKTLKSSNLCSAWKDLAQFKISTVYFLKTVVQIYIYTWHRTSLKITLEKTALIEVGLKPAHDLWIDFQSSASYDHDLLTCRS